MIIHLHILTRSAELKLSALKNSTNVITLTSIAVLAVVSGGDIAASILRILPVLFDEGYHRLSLNPR